MAKSYDKWLLTLSGGGLGLSMAFARDIALPAGVASAGWLLGAWLAFGLAIAAGLAGLYASQVAHKAFRVIVDDAADNVRNGSETELGFWGRVRDQQSRHKSLRWVRRLQFTGFISFLVAIILMSLFAFSTLSKGD